MWLPHVLGLISLAIKDASPHSLLVISSSTQPLPQQDRTVPRFDLEVDSILTIEDYFASKPRHASIPIFLAVGTVRQMDSKLVEVNKP